MILSSRGKFYLDINHGVNFVFVNYNHFDVNPIINMFALIKLRTSSHRLGVESGRWHRPRPIDYADRKCAVCNKLDDEYHFVLECTKFDRLRKMYIPEFFYKHPSMYKFVQLFNSTKERHGLSTFIRKGFAKITNDSVQVT